LARPEDDHGGSLSIRPNLPSPPRRPKHLLRIARAEPVQAWTRASRPVPAKGKLHPDLRSVALRQC
jgi:hypothetical protein